MGNSGQYGPGHTSPKPAAPAALSTEQHDLVYGMLGRMTSGYGCTATDLDDNREVTFTFETLHNATSFHATMCALSGRDDPPESELVIPEMFVVAVIPVDPTVAFVSLAKPVHMYGELSPEWTAWAVRQETENRARDVREVAAHVARRSGRQ